MERELRQEIVDIYRRRAGDYDITANLYYLIGYPEWRYRRLGVNALGLTPGDTVVEIGCGTGLNFGLLQEKVGPQGKIIGVDLTDAMLEQARQRVAKHGWQNVELIQRDATLYNFPENVNGVFSTFAISLIPDAPQIIERASQALAPGGRIALVDFEVPDAWPGWLTSLAMALVRPFTPVEDWLPRRPWEAIHRAMRGNLEDITLEHYYLGMTYIMSGGRPPHAR